MLKQGIYEHIINNQVEKEISKAKNFGLVCKKQPVDNAESPKYWQITWQRLYARNLKILKPNKTE